MQQLQVVRYDVMQPHVCIVCECIYSTINNTHGSMYVATKIAHTLYSSAVKILTENFLLLHCIDLMIVDIFAIILL